MKTGNLAAGGTEELRRRIAELEILLDLERSTVKDLAEAEHRHNQVFALMSDAVLVHREGRIIFANPLAVELYGAETTEQLIGSDPQESRVHTFGTFYPQT